MKPIRALITILLLASGVAYTQQPDLPELSLDTEYKTAIGIRAGGTSGLTIKQFIGPQAALDGILGLWAHGFSATLLYERHVPAFSLAGMKWYYGVGGHVSVYDDHDYYHWHGEHHYHHDGEIGLGVDGIVGLEYAPNQIPFAFSLDFKPYTAVTTDGDVRLSLDPGFGIKVTF